jgi:hypothetical protein
MTAIKSFPVLGVRSPVSSWRNNARPFAFFFYRFCHHRGGRERIEVQPQAEVKAQKAIRFRFERLKWPKTALLERLYWG